MSLYQATERLYRTRDDRIVPEGDPDAHQLFVPKGGFVSFQAAERYGLTAPSPQPAAVVDQDAPPQDQEQKARSVPPKTKHRAGPPATK